MDVTASGLGVIDTVLSQSTTQVLATIVICLWRNGWFTWLTKPFHTDKYKVATLYKKAQLWNTTPSPRDDALSHVEPGNGSTGATPASPRVDRSLPRTRWTTDGTESRTLAMSRVLGQRLGRHHLEGRGDVLQDQQRVLLDSALHEIPGPPVLARWRDLSRTAGLSPPVD